jgi:tetratricopeptide (TPR) repeat protein
MAKSSKKASPQQGQGQSNVKINAGLLQRRFSFEWLILAFSLFIYANSIFNDYNLDDELVTQNHRLTAKGISAIPEIFSSPYYQDQSGYSYEYRPVVLTSFAIEHEFFGDNPTVGHFFNVLLYGLACVLLYRVLRLLFKHYSPILSLAIVLLFVAHPAHTEVVCSIKNRDEILGLLFSLLSFLLILKAITSTKLRMLVPVPVLFTLALLSKNTMIPFVVIIPIGIVLLTEASFAVTIVSTLLILVPSFFLLPTSVNVYRLALFVGVLGLTIGLYILLHFTATLNTLKAVFKKHIKTEMKNAFTYKEDNAHHVNDSIFPDKSFYYLPVMFLMVSGAILYSLGVTSDYFLYVAIIPFLFILFIMIGVPRTAFWAKIMLDFCLIYTLLKFGNSWNNPAMYRFDNLFSNILTVYAFYQFSFYKKPYFIPSLLFLLAVVTIGVFVIKLQFFLIPSLLFLTMVRFYAKDRFKQASIFLVFLLIVANLYNIFQPETQHFIVIDFGILQDLFPGALIILSFYLGSKRKYLIPFYAFIVFVILDFNQYEYTKAKSLENTSALIVEKSKAVSFEIVSNPQVRPLHYVEECISSKSLWSIKAGTSFEIGFHYLGKVLFPYPLSFYYGYKFIKPQHLSEPVPLTSLAIHLLLFLLVIFSLKRSPILSFALSIYLIAIVAFSNYFIPIPGMVADRFLLIPSLGVLILIGLLLHFIGKIHISTPLNWHSISAIPKFSFLAMLFIYSTLTFSRNLDWKNYLTLFRKDVQYVKNSAQAHNLLAIRLVKTSFDTNSASEQIGLRQEALVHFKEATAIYPDFFNANYDLARCYLLLNLPDSAIPPLQKTISLDSTFTDATYTLAELYINQNKFEEAKTYYALLIKQLPYQYTGYEKLGFIYYHEKNYSKAIEITNVAIAKMPNIVQPYLSLVKIYYGAGAKDSSLYWLKKAIAIDPGNIEAQQLSKQLYN